MRELEGGAGWEERRSDDERVKGAMGRGDGGVVDGADVGELRRKLQCGVCVSRRVHQRHGVHVPDRHLQRVGVQRVHQLRRRQVWRDGGSDPGCVPRALQCGVWLSRRVHQCPRRGLHSRIRMPLPLKPT